MSIFSKLLGKEVSTVTNAVGSIIDNVTVSDEEKVTLKNQTSKLILDSFTSIANAQRDVLVQELKGNFLQKSWRPLLMLTFTAIILLRYTGIVKYQIPVELEIELLSLIKLGIGGYIGGRSVEKVATTVTQNMDLSFLRKKDRKEVLLSQIDFLNSSKSVN